jgi:hypothetical protein
VLNQLSTLQRDLLAVYVECLGPSLGNVAFYATGRQGVIGGRPYSRPATVIVHMPIKVTGGAAVHFYGSLGDSLTEEGEPRDHEHQFITLVDEEDAELVRFVAYARIHHALGAPLDAHHSFLLDEESGLRARGYTNSLVTRADLYAPFAAKNDFAVGGVGIRLLGLVPLTHEEWRIKVDLGTDALLSNFQETGRDLLSLRPTLR